MQRWWDEQTGEEPWNAPHEDYLTEMANARLSQRDWNELLPDQMAFMYGGDIGSDTEEFQRLAEFDTDVERTFGPS